MLEVVVYESVDNPEGQVFEEIDYVSLVSPETYGPPALVAPTKGGGGPRASVGDRVLYINTRLVPLFEIERVSD